jgi:hypothetical protein
MIFKFVWPNERIDKIFVNLLIIFLLFKQKIEGQLINGDLVTLSDYIEKISCPLNYLF